MEILSYIAPCNLFTTIKHCFLNEIFIQTMEFLYLHFQTMLNLLTAILTETRSTLRIQVYYNKLIFS